MVHDTAVRMQILRVAAVADSYLVFSPRYLDAVVVTVLFAECHEEAGEGGRQEEGEEAVGPAVLGQAQEGEKGGGDDQTTPVWFDEKLILLFIASPGRCRR